MSRVWSLRSRLTALILAPLLLIAMLIAAWSIQVAERSANDRFNNALLIAALAVSRDVALSGGDALSPRTTELISDTSGGQVFYHAFAPDGVFVTGYATPPVPVTETFIGTNGVHFYDGVHQSRTVRAVRFVDAMQLEGLSGDFTVTVWQDQALLRARVTERSLQVLRVIGLLIAAVALIVWFGVRFGLRPLTDLEDAIDRRSSDDLGPIRRPVPGEVSGVVATLNRLFGQVSRSMTAQADFISNAAHQLRNPIAGVLALAEAVERAPDLRSARRRARDLHEAAEEASALSQKLLLLERAKAISPASAMEPIDLVAALEDWVADLRALLPSSVALELKIAPDLPPVTADATMLREALRNLVDNALRHGGPGLSQISVAAAREAGGTSLSVTDNGSGMTGAEAQTARERFRSSDRSTGSGLGVSIVDAVMQGHGGTLTLEPQSPGLRARLWLPA